MKSSSAAIVASRNASSTPAVIVTRLEPKSRTRMSGNTTLEPLNAMEISDEYSKRPMATKR